MYPPPRPPVPPRRTGVPVGAVIGIACAAAMVFGLGGCVVGYAIGTTPNGSYRVGRRWQTRCLVAAGE